MGERVVTETNKKLQRKEEVMLVDLQVGVL